MKKIKVLLLLTFTTFSTAQVKENNIDISPESICKKWEFSDLINPKFTKQEYEETKEMLSVTTIEFRKDNTYTFSFIADRKGTWVLLKNIITTTDKRGDDTWTIHELTSNKITMSRNDSEQKVIFISK